MKKFYTLLSALLVFSFLQSQTTLEEALNFTGTTTHDETLELFPILDEGKLVVIDFFHTE